MVSGDPGDEDCDDMVNLHVLEPGTILRNLESRFGMTKPYTYVGRIVISTNPFQWIGGLYSDETIVAYSRVPDVFADLRPHVYAVARDALDNLTQQQVRAPLALTPPGRGRAPERSMRPPFERGGARPACAARRGRSPARAAGRQPHAPRPRPDVSRRPARGAVPAPRMLLPRAAAPRQHRARPDESAPR